LSDHHECELQVGIVPLASPVFPTIPTLCENQTAPSLPTISSNGIPGSWKPSVISTASTGTTKYVFTPASGYCASSVTVSVTIQTCKQEASISSEVMETPETDTISGREARAFPNPSISSFTLALKSPRTEIVEITVMDLMGHTLYHTKGSATRTYQFGGNFIKGMYFIQVLYSDGAKLLKVIRQ
jgi:hypothetical protein